MKLAKFTTNNTELLIDFKNFDISHKSYFNGDEYHTKEEYKKIYFKVLEICSDTDYTIDSYNDRYTVRSLDEIEELRLSKLTEEEKLQRKIEQIKISNDRKIAELKKSLKDTDYYIIKMMEGAIVKDDILEIILQRQLWRDEINQLEQFDYSTIK